MQNHEYKQYWDYLYPMIFRMVRSSPMDTQNPYDPSEEAKDIVQDAIIIIFRKPPKFPDEKARLAYARITAKHLFIKWRDKRFPGSDGSGGDPVKPNPEIPVMPIRPGHRGEVFVADETPDDEPEMGASNAAEMHTDAPAKNDAWEIVYHCLSELPAKLRLVLTAYFWAIDPRNFQKGANLNEVIAARITAETGSVFTPQSIAVDRTRAIKLLRQAIRRRYPNAGR